MANFNSEYLQIVSSSMFLMNSSLLGGGSSKVCAFIDLFCFVLVFLSLDNHELWRARNMMSTCPNTVVKYHRATLVLGRVTTSVHYSCL